MQYYIYITPLLTLHQLSEGSLLTTGLRNILHEGTLDYSLT